MEANFRVKSTVFPVKNEIITKLPKDSCLRNILDPDPNFSQQTDEQGNILLLNNEIEPETVKLILDYLETENEFKLLGDKSAVQTAMEYFGLKVPESIQQSRSFSDLLEHSKQVEKQHYSKYQQAFLPTATTMSSELLSTLKQAVESSQPNGELLDDKVDFYLEVYKSLVSVKIHYKRFEATAKADIKLLGEQANVRYCYADLFLNLMWGLGISREDMEKENGSNNISSVILVIPASKFINNIFPMDLNRPPKPIRKPRNNTLKYKLGALFRSAIWAIKTNKHSNIEQDRDNLDTRENMDTSIPKDKDDRVGNNQMDTSASESMLPDPEGYLGRNPTFKTIQRSTLIGKYKKICNIGHGANGMVIKAIDPNDNIVAIKILGFKSQKEASREQDMHELMGTSAGNIIKFNNNYCIVMKCLEGKTLEQELLDPDSPYNPLDLYIQSRNLLLKMLANNCYHGDANSGNFIASQGTVFLIDYGSSGKSSNLSFLLEKTVSDIKKLASNVYSELRFKNSSEAEVCRQEAQLDYSDPERNAKSLLLKLYKNRYYHGNPTTSSVMVTFEGVYLIDYIQSQGATTIGHTLDDFKILAADVYNQLKYRNTAVSHCCMEEARLDYRNPELIIGELE
ncbi:hypothetical protein HDV01_003227 [Terramyces sp. JEL0728]|nr:hypothetical protein HDV01_003227 [Terramyces sp. JEL0728]